MTRNKLVPLLEDSKLHLPPLTAEILDITYSTEAPVTATHYVHPENLLLPFANGPLVHMPIKDVEYLCQGDDVKTVIEITLDNKDDHIKFKSGDTIGILPQNSSEEVDYLLERLGLKDASDQIYNLHVKSNSATKKAIVPTHLPLYGKLRDVFFSCVDIRSILKKNFIYVLSKYTTDSIEKRCLEELCSKEGSLLYQELVLSNHMSIADLLRKYVSCNPPVSVLLQHLPRLMPRPYSICNSYDEKQNVIKFCFSVFEIKQNINGVATTWMKNIADKFLVQNKENSVESLTSKIEIIDLTTDGNSYNSVTIPVYLRKSNLFSLPSDLDKPITMIALGTGVAPFIGFLIERQRLAKSIKGNSLGTSTLYFGCRYFVKDFLFKKTLEQFIADSSLTKLRSAHSKEPDANAIYVQDNIIKDKHEIVKNLDDGGIIYACGDINTITNDIKQTIVQCLCDVKGVDSKEAEEMFAYFKKNNQFILDVWS